MQLNYLFIVAMGIAAYNGVLMPVWAWVIVITLTTLRAVIIAAKAIADGAFSNGE